MVEYAPASGSLALWVQHRDLPEDDPHDAVVHTDGRCLFYSPAFEALDLAEQTGWVAHQVLHIALRHAQRAQALQQRLGTVDLQLFNLCADAIVNSTLAHLGWLTLPRAAVRLGDVLPFVLQREQDEESALLEWDVERLYQAVDDRRPGAAPSPRRQRAGRRDDRTGDGSQSANAGGSSGSPDATPGEGPAPQAARMIDGARATRMRILGAQTAPDLRPAPAGVVASEDEADLTREWSERLLRAHAGDGVMSLLRTLPADLPRVRTPWEQLLRRHAARALAQQPGLSWSRPSRSYLANQGRSGPARRMPWEPGRSAVQAVPRVVLVVDTSGSIDNGLLSRFARELAALMRRLHARLVLVEGDDQVQQVRIVAPGTLRAEDLQFRGGGGTDFTPLLEEAERHRPDLIVVLTDLDGPVRHRPHCPVIWAVPETLRPQSVPFGRLLPLL
jgi:predicted metal-dependent peptidase